MFSKRITKIGCVFTGIFALLAIRLIYITTQNGKAYQAMALSQQKREVDVCVLRGSITDRNGVQLTDTKNQKMYLSKSGKVSANNADSVYEFVVPKRQPQSARHLIGYTNSSKQGISGIEKEFDFVLKNKGNIRLSYMADARGTPLDSFKLDTETKNTNALVHLTIDDNIQKIAETVMDKYVKKGAAVILDCRNFDVLAMVSRPDFNDDKIEKYTSSDNGELLNRAIMGYNAGSVFKIVTASTALEKTTEYTQRTFNCLGRYDLSDGISFNCHESGGHGFLLFNQAFAHSCNCSFYVTGLEVGGNALVTMAKKFGLGESLLNINSEENPGNLPQKTDFTEGDILNLSIGQGEILISPLQCAVMAAVVANNGIRQDVNIVSGYTNENGIYTNLKNTQSYNVISPLTATILSQMMRECVTDGTAQIASSAKVSIAGKTGSAESGWVQNESPLVHGWFCGFFPYEAPQYAAVILSEGGRSGAGTCVEPFVELAEKINEIYPLK